MEPKNLIALDLLNTSSCLDLVLPHESMTSSFGCQLAKSSSIHSVPSRVTLMPHVQLENHPQRD